VEAVATQDGPGQTRHRRRQGEDRMIALERCLEIVDGRAVEENCLDLVDDIVMVEAGQGVEKGAEGHAGPGSIRTPPWRTVV